MAAKKCRCKSLSAGQGNYVNRRRYPASARELTTCATAAYWHLNPLGRRTPAASLLTADRIVFGPLAQSTVRGVRSLLVGKLPSPLVPALPAACDVYIYAVAYVAAC